MSKSLSDLTYEDYAAHIAYKSGRASERTLSRYWKYITNFRCWLAKNPTNDRDALRDRIIQYNRILRKRYRTNSLLVVLTALNWLFRCLRTKDEDGEIMRLTLPQRELLHHQRIVTEADWEDIQYHLKVKGTPKELVCITVLNETGLRPSDVVSIRLDQLILQDEHPRICLTARKNKAEVISRITSRTAQLIKRYLKTEQPETYLFEPSPDKPYYSKWPLRILRKHGIEEISPRTFRRTLATRWPGDVKDLQYQGGWKDSKTILENYKQGQLDRHNEAFDTLFGKEHKEDDNTGYA